jgi:hypothetical protein
MKPGGRGKNDLVFNAACQRRGVEISDRTDAEFGSLAAGMSVGEWFKGFTGL